MTTQPYYMDAVIQPNRSLSQRGFVVLISVVTLANCASALVFIAMGALYVPFFLGVDVLAVVAAFLASFNAAKRIERVQVTPGEIVVTHEAPNWRRVVWESPTAFTRIVIEKDENRMVGLRLALSGREVAVAEAISPGERAAFATALERAIHRARNARY